MQSLLENVPDWTNWQQAEQWILDGQSVASNFDASTLCESNICSLEWHDITAESNSTFGHYSNKNWRQFVLATFLADLISYPIPEDQVDFDRLAFVMHGFPQGFRLWWVKHPNGQWWPAGYTGWYPMSQNHFALMHHTPEQIHNRLVAPQESSPYLYLFNYSVAPNLKKSLVSKRLMHRYAEDIKAIDYRGLACITVSDEGIKVAQRFGMSASDKNIYTIKS